MQASNTLTKFGVDILPFVGQKVLKEWIFEWVGLATKQKDGT